MADRSESNTKWVGEALQKYERPLVRYALRFTGNAEQARDVVQDTFLKLCREDRAQLDGHMAQWLYRVCRNRALDVRKKEGRMEALDRHTAEAQPDLGSTPDESAELHEEHALVLEVLAVLPEAQQEAFRLKFEHGLTYREIGSVMDMPLSTVSHTITQALGTIRTRLRTRLDRKDASS